MVSVETFFLISADFQIFVIQICSDYWSIGIFLYEVLFGDTPFYDESLIGTYGKIMDHNNSLVLPDDMNVSNHARSLIRAFLTDQEKRLGRNGIEAIKVHPFFANDKWTFDNIHESTPPIIPDLEGDDDTSNFSVEEFEQDTSTPEVFSPPKAFAGDNIPFVGFTYNDNYPLLQMAKASAGNGLAGSVVDGRPVEQPSIKSNSSDPNASRLAELNQILEGKLQTALVTVDKQNQDISLLSKDKCDLEKCLAVLGNECKDWETKFTSEVELKVNAEKRLFEYKAKLDEQTTVNTKLNSTVTALTEKCSNMEKQVSLISDKLKVEKENVTVEKNRNVQLDQLLVSKEQSINEMSNKNEMFEKILESRDREISELRNQLRTNLNLSSQLESMSFILRLSFY